MSAQGAVNGPDGQSAGGRNTGSWPARFRRNQPDHKGTQGAGSGKQARVPRPGWMYSIPALGALGVLMTLVYVSQVGSGKRWSVFGTAVVIAGAAAAVGGVVGFLFGIPLTSKQRAAGASESQYETNTNLEQVSDWLTKIIVGVGLVQIGRALPALTKLAKSLNDPLGGKPYGGAFGLGLTIFYALLGFFFLYLWSRTDFTSELQQLTGIVQTQIDKVESDLSNALLLVDRQLNSLKGGQKPTQDELNQAIAAAPDSTRLQIFHEAEHIRNANMSDYKELMALTIPVFCALIAADIDEKYYRPHGSLGWALKDKLPPDWQEAKAELTKAIAIRTRLNITGWRLYEVNRAVCNINILKSLPPGDPTRTEITESIEHDLDAAQGDPHCAPMLDSGSSVSDPYIRQWIHEHPRPQATPTGT
jgi:parvulin-like peptidyl-prolyl isomerase